MLCAYMEYSYAKDICIYECYVYVCIPEVRGYQDFFGFKL